VEPPAGRPGDAEQRRRSRLPAPALLEGRLEELAHRPDVERRLARQAQLDRLVGDPRLARLAAAPGARIPPRFPGMAVPFWGLKGAF